MCIRGELNVTKIQNTFSILHMCRKEACLCMYVPLYVWQIYPLFELQSVLLHVPGGPGSIHISTQCTYYRKQNYRIHIPVVSNICRRNIQFYLNDNKINIPVKQLKVINIA